MYNIINLSKKLSFLVIALFFSTVVFSQNLKDVEIKKNIVPINDPLEKLMQLKPQSFEYDTKTYKHLQLQQGRQYGFLAEELQGVFPDLVKEKSVSYMFGKNTYRNTKIKTIDEASLIPVLVASIQEQQKKIEKLQSEIMELKSNKSTASN